MLEDADLELAVDKIARGIYSYAGQRCDAIKLVLAESAIYDRLKDGLAKGLASVKRSKKSRRGDGALNPSRGYRGDV